MNTTQLQTMTMKTNRRVSIRIDPTRAAHVGVWLSVLVLVVVSAIWTKENATLPALAVLDQASQPVAEINTPAIVPAAFTTTASTQSTPEPIAETAIEQDTSIRWFDGRAAKPSRVIYMTVTGYSPDERSCGEFADGKTATMYSVWTNGMNLVAADPRLLPYWSLVSVPGYADGEIVPVLDCGGAIKGNRIDLLYPTHNLARNWGVRQVPVTVWEYIDEG